MMFNFVIRTILELAAVIAVIYGFAHEDKFIALEERIFERMRHK